MALINFGYWAVSSNSEISVPGKVSKQIFSFVVQYNYTVKNTKIIPSKFKVYIYTKNMKYHVKILVTYKIKNKITLIVDDQSNKYYLPCYDVSE